MKRYHDCIRTDGLCGACSVSSYGKDCHGNVIGKLLYLRSHVEMTQQQVSQAAGINLRQYQKMESGESKMENITLKNAIALAKVLECDVEDFI